MGKREWIVIAVVAFMAMGPLVTNALMGGADQTRCVGVDATGVVVKAVGMQCDRLGDVVYMEMGPNGVIRYSEADVAELEP